MQRPNEDGNAAANAVGPPPMFSDAQMRKLKAAVIIMGAILLAGFALVIGRLVYLLNRPPVDAAADSRGGATVSTAAPTVAASFVPQAQLALPDGAVIRHLSLSGNKLAVHFEAPTGQGIHIFDLVSGRPVQRIDVVPGRPAR